MTSSTSNSDEGKRPSSRTFLQLTGLLLRDYLPATLIAGAAILAAGLHALQTPIAPRNTIDWVILNTQIERSHSTPSPDILIVGDSSGLTGIDAPLLDSLLDNTHIESLSSIASVGPRGYLKLAQNCSRRGTRIPILLLVVHGESLRRRADHQREEAIVMDDAWPQRPFLPGARTVLNGTLFGNRLDPPLPGDWGRFYGPRSGLSRYLRTHQGSAVDPLLAHPSASAYRYVLFPAIRARLARFANLLPSAGVDRLLVILAPIPESMVDPLTLETRHSVLREIQSLLNLNADQWVSTPVSMPDHYFCTPTHLNQSGRKRFTRRLAERLTQALETTN